MDDIKTRAAAALKHRRLALGLTLAQYAEKFDVDVEDYEDWEEGVDFPDMHSTFALIEMLSVEEWEKLGIFLGPLLDSIRGPFLDQRNRAHEAIDIIIERCPNADRGEWVKTLEEAAANYSADDMVGELVRKRTEALRAERSPARRPSKRKGGAK